VLIEHSGGICNETQRMDRDVPIKESRHRA
jgi:hypothetical protein